MFKQQLKEFITHLYSPQEKEETLKDVLKQLKPLRERHQTHLVSQPETVIYIKFNFGQQRYSCISSTCAFDAVIKLRPRVFVKKF